MKNESLKKFGSGSAKGRPDSQTHTAPSGLSQRAADVVTGKPTVADNSGTAGLPSGMRRRYDPASIAAAEFLRLPQPGTRCWLTSLSRSTLNELIDAGEIRAVTIRQPGARRGIKLLNKQSVLAYLAKLDAEQNQEAPAGKETEFSGGDFDPSVRFGAWVASDAATGALVRIYDSDLCDSNTPARDFGSRVPVAFFPDGDDATRFLHSFRHRIAPPLPGESSLLVPRDVFAAGVWIVADKGGGHRVCRNSEGADAGNRCAWLRDANLAQLVIELLEAEPTNAEESE